VVSSSRKRNWCDPTSEISDSFLKAVESKRVGPQPRNVLPLSVSNKDDSLHISVPPIPDGVEFQASDVPIQAKRTKVKKASVPVVNSTPRMTTRSQANLQGFKPNPVSGVEVKRRKKNKKKVAIPKDVPRSVPDGRKGDDAKTPPMPVPMIQNIGSCLGIDPQDLTVEKLTALPEDGAPSTVVPNED
jgi:hypothetical protein